MEPTERRIAQRMQRDQQSIAMRALEMHVTLSPEERALLSEDFEHTFMAIVESQGADGAKAIFDSYEEATRGFNEERDAIVARVIRKNGWKGVLRGALGQPSLTYDEIMAEYDSAVDQADARMKS